jgi:hypothetical protein
MSNKMTHRVILLIAAILFPFPAAAQSCSLFDYRSSVLSFGRFQLGEDRSHIPSDVKKLANCLEEPSSNYYDCEYADKDGVRYLVYEHQVIQKTVTKDEAKDVKLPAGLSLGDPISVVLGKLATLPEDAPEWVAHASKSEGEFYLSAGICLVDQAKAEWHFRLGFDVDGELTEVSSFFTPN